MPVYGYRCDKCHEEFEITAPMSESGQERFCLCGNVLRRLFSPFGLIIPVKGRQKVLNTLNQEGQRLNLPGNSQDIIRYKNQMAKSLDTKDTAPPGTFRPIKTRKEVEYASSTNH